MTNIIGRIKEGVILTFTALRSKETAKDVGKEFAKIVPFLDKLIEFSEKTGEIVEKNEVVRFYKTIRDASVKAKIGNIEIDSWSFLNKLKEEFETLDPEDWSGDPIDVPGTTLVLEMVKVKDDRKARYCYHFRRRFIENFRDYYKELKTRDGEIKFLEKLEEAKRFADYKFLEKLEEEIGRIPPIKEYYQPNPCCRRKYSKWIEGAKRDCSTERLKNIKTVIYDFINSSEQALLLAADFGIGKTTASRYFVSELAEKYYEHGYLPLYFRLSEIGTTPPRIKKTIKDVTTMYEKTLIVLDGLDEISKEKRDSILDFIDNYLPEHMNTKIIVASRFGIYSKDVREAKEFLFDKLGIQKYYQLMPLTEELARNMLEKLGCLSFDEVKDLGISEEEYTKPIYLYLLWVLKKAGRLEKLRGYGKSGIYLALTNLVSRYKAKCVEDEETKKELKEIEELKARNVLIHIAVLRTMFESEGLSKGKIEELLSDDVRKYPDGTKIETDFLITTYLRDPDNLTFIHKSFQEYLSAEFLLMSFLSSRYESLYIFPLTQEILEFLRGLAKMLERCIKSGDTEEFKELLKLVGRRAEDLSIEDLIVKAKECLRGQYCIPFFEDISCSGLSLRFCRFNDIENLIKLLISGKVAVMEIGQAISRDKLLENLSSKDKVAIEKILKYNYLPLNLRGAILREADLSGTVMNGAILSEADLRGADLRNVNWKGFKVVNLPIAKEANFENAKINDIEFIEYLRKYGAINVPDPVDD